MRLDLVEGRPACTRGQCGQPNQLVLQPVGNLAHHCVGRMPFVEKEDHEGKEVHDYRTPIQNYSKLMTPPYLIKKNYSKKMPRCHGTLEIISGRMGHEKRRRSSYQITSN